MKKLFTLLLLPALLLCSSATAYAGVGDPLDRSTWTLKASSACNDDNSGQIDAIKDGDVSTRWHSSWTTDASTNPSGLANHALPHWFIVDLGEIKDLGGFAYTARQDAANGRCKAYKVFVSETEFTGFNTPTVSDADHDAVAALTGEVTSGTFDSGVLTEQTVIFDSKVTGRYVMFVYTASEGSFASCSEFNLYEFSDAVRTNITYKYMIGDWEYKSVTQEVNSNSLIEAPAQNFVKILSCEAAGEAVGETPRTVTVTCEEALPFKVSESENIYPYTVRIHSGSKKWYWQYNGTGAIITSPVLNEALTTVPADERLFYIRGSLMDGFKIYSVVGGEENPLTSTTNNPLFTAGEGTTWSIHESRVMTTDEGVCFKAKDGSTNYINSDGNKNLAYWWDNDQGSSCKFIPASTFLTNFVETMNADALAEAPAGALGTLTDQYNASEAENLVTTLKENPFDATATQALQQMFISSTITPGYYRIVNKKSLTDGVMDMIGSEGNKAFCYASANNNADFVWALEAGANGKFKLHHLNTGLYLTTTATGGGSKTTIETEGVDHTFTYIADGVFNIKSDGCNFLLQAENHYLNGWSAQADWYIVPAKDIEIDLNAFEDAAYATTYLPFAVTVSENSGVTANAITVAGNEATPNAFTGVVPANTGMLLIADNAATDKVVLNLSEEAGTAQENALSGTNVVISDITATDYLVFGLNTEKQLGFFRPEATSLKANKAFISTAAVQAAGLRLNLGDVTGIDSLAPADNAPAVIYDLSGRRVAKATKGVYIMNGKKVVVK